MTLDGLSQCRLPAGRRLSPPIPNHQVPKELDALARRQPRGLGAAVQLSGARRLFRPIDGSPKELQQFINSGELPKRGDRIRGVSADKKAHVDGVLALT
jgi:hypothetical protein